jgi:thymidylate synthase
MRSSDAWSGWPYDVFNFSTMAQVVALGLRARGLKVLPGALHLTAGSSHLYGRDMPAAQKIVADWDERRTPPLLNYQAINLDEFDSAQHLIRHLGNLAHGGEYTEPNWLRELFS